MNEYYLPGRLLDTSNPVGGTWISAWQHIKDGAQVEFTDASSPPLAITPPETHEFILTSQEPHFAPGVLNDPNMGYTPPTMEEYLAAVKAGTLDQLLTKANQAASAAAVVAQLANPTTATTVSLATPAVQASLPTSAPAPAPAPVETPSVVEIPAPASAPAPAPAG